MRYKIRELPAMLRSSQGRRSLFLGQLSHFFPVFRFLAGLYRRCFLRGTCAVVVIGSLGKTTTARIAVKIVGDSKHSGTKNANLAVIYNLLKYRPEDKHAIMEVGIEKPGQMVLHARMIRPDIVVVTSIASEHILSFKSLGGIREEKAAMIRALTEEGTAILNADDPHVMWMATQTKASIVTYGITNDADIKAENIENNFPEGTSFDVSVRGKAHKCQTRLLGTHMVYPALAAIALAQVRGLDIAAACEELSRIAAVESRMQSVRIDSGAIIIRDDFKSTRESIWTALDTLMECPARRKIVIIGAASEITNDLRYTFHRELGERIAEVADQAYVINRKEIFRSIRQGASRLGMDASRLVRVEGNVLSVIPMLPEDLGEGDVILIKGRTNQRLARIGLALAGGNVKCVIPSCPSRNFFCDDCRWLESGPGKEELYEWR